MKYRDNFDRQILVATEQIRNSMLETIPDLSDYEYSYSDEYTRKIDALIRDERKRENAKRIVRGLVAVFMAIVIGSGVWLSIDTSARASFSQWVKETIGINHFYRFSGAEKKEHIQEYDLGWLPTDYSMIESNDTGTGKSYCYSNGTHMIIFEYFAIEDGREIQVIADAESSKTEKVKINGIMADLYEGDQQGDNNVLVWVDEEKNMVFSLSSDIDVKQMIKVANNVQLKK